MNRGLRKFDTDGGYLVGMLGSSCTLPYVWFAIVSMNPVVTSMAMILRQSINYDHWSLIILATYLHKCLRPIPDG